MAENINVMEFIWRSIEKAPDGSVLYSIEFVDYLWDYNFVDTQKYPKQEWRSVFEPFKQASGGYRLNRDEFLSLDKYRYTGEIKIPFDAMRINEGKYTDEGLDQLANESILPSASLDPTAFKTFTEAIKKEFRQPDGLILIQIGAKHKIKKMLDENPSPLRRLEIMFDAMGKKAGAAKQAEADLRSASKVASKEELAALQTSTFTTGPASIAEAKAAALKNVTKPITAKHEPEDLTGEPLKKIKRSTKGMRS